MPVATVKHVSLSKDQYCELLLDEKFELVENRYYSRFDAARDMASEPDGYMPEPTQEEWDNWCDAMSESEEGVASQR